MKRKGDLKMSPSLFSFFFVVVAGQGDRSSWRMRCGGGSSLPNLHIVGWEQTVSSSADASPPALVNHLNVGDDVVRVKGDLVVTG